MDNRTEHGHEYQWCPDLGYWINLRGNPVLIFPSSRERVGVNWTVVVPHKRVEYTLNGTKDVERRAFEVASEFITQEVVEVGEKGRVQIHGHFGS